MKHIKRFKTTEDYRKHLSDGGGVNDLPKVSYLCDTEICKYDSNRARKAYFLRVESDIDGDGVNTLEPLVYDTTGIKSVKINGIEMTDFVPKTTTKTVQTFEDILNSIEFKNEPFYETIDENGDTIFLMNDPKNTSLYIDPDSKFVFSDGFDIDEYYVMLFAKSGFLTIVSENYPLSQIVGTQADLILNGNTFELSENFKKQLKEYQALGINPVAIPYKITSPYESDYTLETIKVDGTTQILPTEDMFKNIKVEVVIDGETFLDDFFPIVEIEFEFDTPSISPFIFSTTQSIGSLVAVNKYFYNGLDKIPYGTYNDLFNVIGAEIRDNKLILDFTKEYSIPESVVEISDDSFSTNALIKKINIPDSVKTIGNYAFSNCWLLDSITIPKSVNYVGEDVFGYCENLNKIIVKSEIAPSGFNNTLISEYYYSANEGVLYHPKGSNYTNWLWALKEGWRSIAIENGVDTTDENRYLCFEPIENGLTISMINQNRNLYYKVNNGEWQTLSIGGVTQEFNVGQKIYFKGDSISSSSGIGTFVFNKNVKASGPVESLVGQCNILKSPLISLFKDCKNLIQAPRLAALSLCPQAYYGMFENCTSLVEAPELPASVLSDYCYYAMFKGCTSLIKAPKLLATKMTNFCYAFMFNDCTSLIEAPELKSKDLAVSCYNEMFMGCTSLVEAPELPATIMQDSCYFGMFVGCSSLVNAPILKSKKLARLCYGFMFQNCTSLTNVQETLPAVALFDSCYQAMFLNCTELTTAPVLPAKNLVENCYSFMFQHCSNLSYIKAMFVTEPSITYTYAWVQNVALNGTFVKNVNATWNNDGTENSSPYGWTIETATI